MPGRTYTSSQQSSAPAIRVPPWVPYWDCPPATARALRSEQCGIVTRTAFRRSHRSRARWCVAARGGLRCWPIPVTLSSPAIGRPGRAEETPRPFHLLRPNLSYPVPSRCGARSRDRRRAGWAYSPRDVRLLATGGAIRGRRAMGVRARVEAHRMATGPLLGGRCRKYRRQPLHLTNRYQGCLTLILTSSMAGPSAWKPTRST
jgi:hypothetical protein